MANQYNSCFFQIKVSPTQKPVEENIEEEAVLVLAPFQKVPKIHFENVKLGTMKTHTLIIRNPGNVPAQVELTKLPSEQEGFSFSTTTCVVNGHSDIKIQVSWRPTKEGCRRDVIKVNNSYNLKLDLIINSKAVSPPKMKRRNVFPLKSCNGSKASTIVAKKSGIKQVNYKSLPVPKSSVKNESFIKQCTPRPKKCSLKKNNAVLESFSAIIGDQLPPCIVPTTPSRRETYAVCGNEENKENVETPLPAAFSSLTENFNCNKDCSPNVCNNAFPDDRRKTFDIRSCPKPMSTSSIECSISVSTVKKKTFRSKTVGDISEEFNFNKEIPKSCPKACSTSKMNTSFELNKMADLNFETFNDSLDNVFVNEKTDTEEIFTDWRIQEDILSLSLEHLSEKSAFSNSTPYRSNTANESNSTCLTDKFERLNLSSCTAFGLSAVQKKMPTFSPSIVKRLDELDFSEVNTEICDGTAAEATFDLKDIQLSSPDIAHLSSDTFVKSESSFPELWSQIQDLEVAPIQSEAKGTYYLASQLPKFDHMPTAGILQESRESTENHSFCRKESLKDQNTAFEISPPKGSFYSDLCDSSSKAKTIKTSAWPKSTMRSRSQVTKPSTKDSAPSLCRTRLSSLYGVKKPKLSLFPKKKEPRSAQKKDPESFLISLARPRVVSMTEPFTSSAVYFDEEWLAQQEIEYIKWLNCLLTPPAELHCNTALPKVDVADLYMQSCRQQKVEPAPSRETVSSQYHTQHRLESLRKAAMSLFCSNDIANVLSKTVVYIDKNLLAIRDDRDLHRDIGLKCMVIQLLLCYNPLWLRVGLETIYGENIHLQSNSDVVGLTRFIANRLLHDPYIFKQHSHPTVRNLPTPGFAPAMKKFTLKKFLLLVYFLDQAKEKKLIGHDPCLFCKNAEYKESRDILISFSRELLSGIGDITRHLKSLGYVVSHKQTYLDEFDYAVTSLGTDLRDGIRLCRVMEIILEERSLSQKLRMPAISRLQKIHNVDVALSALKDAGYELTGGIEAKDICNGHREKTLSLLWQIIYKFQAPRFQIAAKKIQTWWRCISLKLKIAWRIEQRKLAFLAQAAIIIQAHWKGYKARQSYKIVKEQAKERNALFTEACIIIQKYWRMYHAQLIFKRQHIAARKIQSWYKSVLAMRIERNKYIRKRSAILKLQAYCRGYLLRQCLKKLRRMAAALRIQTWYRNQKRSRRIEMILYLYKQYVNERLNELSLLERAAITIQDKFRSTLKMRKQRETFITQRRAAVLIQQRYRAVLLLRKQRSNFLQQKKAAATIQQHYRSVLLMRKVRTNFLQQKKAAIMIQQRHRASLLMRKERAHFLQQKKAAIIIQQRYHAILLMRKKRAHFLQQKKVAIMIQQRYRGILLMRKERAHFLQQKKAAIMIQQRYRGVLLMRKVRAHFLQQKKAVIMIQQRYRAILLMRKVRAQFLQQKKAAIMIQQRYHAILLMRKVRIHFLQQKKAAIMIQQRYRVILLMRKVRIHFLQQKKAAIMIQQRYRAILLMRKERAHFLQQKKAAIMIQQRYRAILLMRKERAHFLQQKKAAIMIQQRYRAILLMRKKRAHFLQQKKAAIMIQQRHRASLLMKKERAHFLQQKKAAIMIQQRYRAILLMRKVRVHFLQQKKAAIMIQQRYRGFLLMRKERAHFLQQKKAAIMIQQRYHGVLLMRKERAHFLQQKKAAMIIQQRYRAILLMRKERAHFLQQKKAAIMIQQKYHGVLLMRKVRAHFLQQKKAAIMIQQRYRAILLMRKVRAHFLQQKKAAMIIQQRYRAILLMRKERAHFLQQKKAAIIIQQRYRGVLLMRNERTQLLQHKKAIIIIQQRYRRFLQMKKEKHSFLQHKRAATVIQQWFRKQKMKKENSKRQQQRDAKSLEDRAAIKIQALWRGYWERKNGKQKMVADIRKRALDATRNAQPEKILQFRCRNALKMMAFTWLNFQLKAFIELDTVTRLSPEICITVVNHEQALLHIFDFLENSNRANSVIEACQHATNVLLNLAKYKPTMKSVWEVPRSISIFLKLMSSSYGKENLIFCNCCTILWLLAQDANIALEISTMPKIEQRFALWYKKLKPKYDSVRKNLSKVPALPSTEPQWCLNSKHVKWSFTNQFEALTALATTLNIKLQ